MTTGQIIVRESRRMWHNFTYNLRTLLLFEIVYKLLSMAVFWPLFRLSLLGIVRYCGFSYVTGENLGRILRNPLTGIFLFLLLIFMTVYSMIDVSALIFLFDQSEQNHKVNLRQTIGFALKNSLRSFYYKNILLAVVLLFMIPFLNIGIGISFVGTIRLPDLWQQYADSHPWLLILIVMGILLMIYFLTHWLYSFHYFTLEGSRFRLARHQSRKLSRGHEWYGLLALAAIQGVLYLLYLAVSSLGVLLIVLIQKAISRVSLPSSIFVSVIAVFLCALMLVISAFATPLSFLLISTMYYHYKECLGEPVVHSKPGRKRYFPNPKNPKRARIIEICILCGAIVLCSIYTYGLGTGRFQLTSGEDGNTVVTAHRGAAEYYPENTMAAFRGAVNQGADWIELDVQETADGRLIVYHDRTFRRLCDNDASASELTYQQIRKLRFTDYQGTKEEDEQIPLLSQVLRFARWNNVKLNIDLKNYGEDPYFAEKVVREITDEHCRSIVMVSTSDPTILHQIKKLDPKIRCAYMTSVAYGDLGSMSEADAFSLEASNISYSLVNNVHAAGKEILAWTVNDESRLSDMVDLGVDNIITDDVPDSKTTVYEHRSGALYREYIRRLLR